MSRLADYPMPDRTLPSTSPEADLPLLERAFGGPFQLWTKSPAWAPQQHSTDNVLSDQGAGTLVAAALDLGFCADRPTVTPLADGRQVLMIPLARADRTPCAAVSVLDSGEPALLSRLACAALLAVEQQRELQDRQRQADMHVRQVCRDFEELTWLRRLAESLDYRTVGGELRDLAQDVLPSLCEVTALSEICSLHAARAARRRMKARIFGFQRATAA